MKYYSGISTFNLKIEHVIPTTGQSEAGTSLVRGQPGQSKRTGLGLGTEHFIANLISAQWKKMQC
jgi:hypothetical protein